MNDLTYVIQTAVSENTELELTATKAAMLADFTDFLLTENQKYNLTAIRDPEKAAYLHIADSLTVSAYIPGGTVADIGAGGGFPSVPLAVVREDLSVTPIDATQKKINFLQAAAARLSLQNLHPVCGRAEELFAAGGAMRQSFDTVVARAVAPLNILCELCAPAVRLHGRFIAMKGENAEQEASCLAQLTPTLGLSLEQTVPLVLHTPEGDCKRFFYIFEKTKDSAGKFPRAYAQIKKKPLF